MRSKRRHGSRTSEGTGIWVWLLLAAFGILAFIMMAGDTRETRPPLQDMDVEYPNIQNLDHDHHIYQDVEYPKIQNLDHDHHIYQDVGGPATLYHVNIAGHTFEIVGNEQTGKFSWTDSPMNECLKRLVVIPDRMAVIEAEIVDGITRKMMVFDNHGRGMCSSLAFLLYLCAAGKSMSMRSLLAVLTRYIREHYEDHNALFVHSYKDFFERNFSSGSMNEIQICSRKGKGLLQAHYDAFAKVFEVPVKQYKIGFHPAMNDANLRGQWRDYSSGVYSQIGPAKGVFTYSPSTFEGVDFTKVDFTKWCNLLILDHEDPKTGHAVLLGHILSEEVL